MSTLKLHKTIPQKIAYAVKNPRLLYGFIKRLLAPKIFIGSELNRSESDNGTYIYFVQSAVQNYKIFTKFKRHPSYQEILEHASEEDGLGCLDAIKNKSPSFIGMIEKFKENDIIGSPITYDYPGVGSVSPTTLRYVKVASDLRILFGDNIGQQIVEIGVGYGGQLLVNDRIFNIKQYDLFDLPPVLSLVSKYLECHVLNGSYNALTLNQCPGDKEYDLVISNYAFSELPPQLQLQYISKIMSKAKRGYLTMNSGLKNSILNVNHLSIEELKKYLPEFEMFPELPLTAPNNYILVWGHKASVLN